MAINYYFFNAVKSNETYDRLYSAEDITKYLDGIIGSGIMPKPANCLQVIQGTGMQVIVKPGIGFINGHKIENTADYPLTILPAEATLHRIDAIVFYVDKTNRKMGIKVKAGAPDATPNVPKLTRTQDMIEYMLGYVRINKQATSITASNITDTRLNSDVCGVVQGLIQQVDTSTLFEQQQSLFNEMMKKNETAFSNWFQDAKNDVNNETVIGEVNQLKQNVTSLQVESEATSEALGALRNNLRQPTELFSGNFAPDQSSKMKYLPVSNMNQYDILIVRATMGTLGEELIYFYKGCASTDTKKINRSFSVYLNDSYNGCATLVYDGVNNQIGLRVEAIKGWTFDTVKIVKVWGIKA